MLVSFTYPAYLPVVAATAESFILDNEAYTYWKWGKSRLTIRHTSTNAISGIAMPSGIRLGIIPNVIEGSEELNTAYIDQWQYDIAAAFVWHLDESLKKLHWLSQRFRTLCL